MDRWIGLNTLGSYRVYGHGVTDRGGWVHAHLPEDRTLVCYTDNLYLLCGGGGGHFLGAGDGCEQNMKSSACKSL